MLLDATAVAALQRESRNGHCPKERGIQDCTGSAQKAVTFFCITILKLQIGHDSVGELYVAVLHYNEHQRYVSKDENFLQKRGSFTPAHSFILLKRCPCCCFHGGDAGDGGRETRDERKLTLIKRCHPTKKKSPPPFPLGFQGYFCFLLLPLALLSHKKVGVGGTS